MKKAIVFLFVLVPILSACTSKKKYHFDEGEIFHTYYHIKYEAEQNLSDAIMSEFNKFNASLNPFQENSVIYNVNNNIDVEVDSFFTQVFTRSEEIAHFTEGMFDITCAPLVNLWGFGFENLGKVDSATVDSLCKFVGYQKVRLAGDRIQKDDPRLKLNMSAIAKGYAVDVICRLLERNGVENYMCEIGGEVRTKGVNPQGEVWMIGINKPIDDSTGTVSELQAKLPLENMAMATSGNIVTSIMVKMVKNTRTPSIPKLDILPSKTF